MNKVIKKIGSGIIIFTIAVSGILAINTPTAQAASLTENAQRGVQYATGEAPNPNINPNWAFGQVAQIISWVLIAVGILCVAFIIFGAIKFTTSGGDPEKTKSGKSTIMYALIGLIIAILANVIVSLVFNVASQVGN